MISKRGLKLANYISSLIDGVGSVRTEAFGLSSKFQAAWNKAEELAGGEIDEDEHDLWIEMGGLIEEMMDSLDTFVAISSDQVKYIVDALPDE